MRSLIGGGAVGLAFLLTYLVFGPVRLVPPDQCHRQPDGSELCTLMMLPPTEPASLLGFTGTWWVPFAVAGLVGALHFAVGVRRAQYVARPPLS